MNFPKSLCKLICMVLVTGITVQLAACGTLLYPERRGQRSGRIDVGVAVLDGIGLLFFIIPGVIAFAVDFSTGAIYLPGGHRALTGTEGIKVVKVNPDQLRKIDTIKEIVVKETGIPNTIDMKTAQISPLDRTEDIPVRIGKLEKTGYQIK